MSERQKQTPILQLMGPPGGGKTTLARLFLDAFQERSVLAVDASEDSFLSLSYGVVPTATMTTVLEQIDQGRLNRETLDWALQDLPVAVPSESESDILVWPQPANRLSTEQEALLSYGLPRLFRTYDVIIWEGTMPSMVQSWFNSEDIRPLLVITPQDEAFCQSIQVDHAVDHAMVLLSKAQAIDILPATAAFEIQRGNWRFLGKLPPLASPEKRVRELPQYFQECFQKLDLPFGLRPPSI